MKAILAVVAILGAVVAQVDHRDGGNNYHISWLHTGSKMTWGQARKYCNNLRGSWEPISINSRGEHDMVANFLRKDNMPYVWTGGFLSGRNWRWLHQGPTNYVGWSNTGGFGRPQPDNREGSENCLGILNNVYRDGITWHDIGCHHPKPVICEEVKF